jgi:hypothetical protein
MKRTLFTVVALLGTLSGCAQHTPPPVAPIPQTRLGSGQDFGPGIGAITPSDVDLTLDVPGYVIALRVTRDWGVQLIAPLSGSPMSKRGAHYFRGGPPSGADSTLPSGVSSKPCAYRADSRESCVGLPTRYRITQPIQGGAPPDAAGYWLLIVSDAPMPPRDIMRRLEAIHLAATSLVDLVRSIPEPLIAGRTTHWAAYYAPFGTPHDY